MSTANTMINFDGQVLFKVMEGGSYTLGEVVDSVSPTGRSSGIYPTDTFNAKRPAAGGMIVIALTDAAGNGVVDFQCNLRPGDTVTLSSVSGYVEADPEADPPVEEEFGAVTVSVTPVGGVAKVVATIPGVTAHATAFGFWG